MQEKTPEELKKELLHYQKFFLKIDEAIIELKQKVGISEPDLTDGLQFSEVGRGFRTRTDRS
ncbi:MAG TPA: hypothetical protein VMW89_11085 [Desulfatiglandales bacterium]|nr:hypothetical protein [Desulfatiglandales bacterium]